MTPWNLRRKMEEAGIPAAEIDATVGALSRELSEEHCRERPLEELAEMGYSEDDLERSNPYNQWVY